MGKPRSFSPVHNIARRFGAPAPDFGKKDKDKGRQEFENAQRREAGVATKNLAADISSSSFVGIREKLRLINQLQRESDRKVSEQDFASMSDEELAPRLEQAQRNLRDPFFAQAGSSEAFSSVKERFNKIVEQEKKTRAAFQAEKSIRLDQPGQKQLLGSTSSSSLLG